MSDSVKKLLKDLARLACERLVEGIVTESVEAVASAVKGRKKSSARAVQVDTFRS